MTSQRALIFEDACPYDVILGRDFLRHTGIDVKFSNNSTVLWEGIEVPMKPPSYWTRQETLFHTLLVDEELDPFEACFASQIFESKYEEVTPEAVATQQKHLTSLQQQQLAEVLHGFPALFDDTLGHYPHAKLHLEVDASKPPPKFHNAYPVPRLHLETFKKELLRLVEIGIFS